MPEGALEEKMGGEQGLPVLFHGVPVNPGTFL